MKTFYAYMRVSTVKQGKGVSLDVQEAAIKQYAERHNFKILQWFEEKKTAAKQGRPLFNVALKQLNAGKADGIIMHKIDRGARNHQDWTELNNLIDRGIEVHFVHESLDMQARGGRLSADIQAVIAADYIRNLRQEAIKGLYGRLHQGIYPFKAPIGYLDGGKAKAKTIDPIKGPIVQKLFELYASRQYSLKTLVQEARKLRLKTLKGGTIYVSTIALILNNPFYAGLMKVKGQTFNGIHESLVSPDLFREVQNILKGKTALRPVKHSFKFKRLIRCAGCNRSLVGELQKGTVYYRCQTSSCPTTSFRESTIEFAFLQRFKNVELFEIENEMLNEELNLACSDWNAQKATLSQSLKLQHAQYSRKVDRLTDCYIEGGLDKETFEVRKQDLLLGVKQLELSLAEIDNKTLHALEKTKKFLELSKSLINSFKIGKPHEQRELIEIATSNCYAKEKELEIPMVSPFLEISNFTSLLVGEHDRNVARKNPDKIDTLAKTEPSERRKLTREEVKLLLEVIMQTVANLPNDRALLILKSSF